MLSRRLLEEVGVEVGGPVEVKHHPRVLRVGPVPDILHPCQGGRHRGGGSEVGPFLWLVAMQFLPLAVGLGPPVPAGKGPGDLLELAVCPGRVLVLFEIEKGDGELSVVGECAVGVALQQPLIVVLGQIEVRLELCPAEKQSVQFPGPKEGPFGFTAAGVLLEHLPIGTQDIVVVVPVLLQRSFLLQGVEFCLGPGEEGGGGR